MLRGRDRIFDGDHVSREGFMHILGNIIDTWISQDVIIKAAKRVGITSTGISVHHLQKEKFARVAAVSSSSSNQLNKSLSPTTPTTPTKLAKLGLDPPKNVRSGSKEYYSCLLYTSPSPRDVEESRMPSSA